MHALTSCFVPSHPRLDAGRTCCTRLTQIVRPACFWVTKTIVAGIAVVLFFVGTEGICSDQTADAVAQTPGTQASKPQSKNATSKQNMKAKQKMTKKPDVTPAHADQVFATVDGHELKLDVYLPDQSPESVAAGTQPRLFVWIHGGGWRGGSKNRPPLRFLVDHGYAVASISYRFTNKAIFPAQIHDCKSAVRWLRANAERLGYDADQIAVGGSSAGGHLALLMGTSSDIKDLEGDVGGNFDFSSSVHAVIDYFGPSDFVLRDQTQPKIARSATAGSFALLGGLRDGAVDMQLAAVASPTTYVGAGAPPLLVFHGVEDRLVLIDQSERIVDVYRQHKLPVKFIRVPDAGHGGSAFYNAKSRELIVGFLAEHFPAVE